MKSEDEVTADELRVAIKNMHGVDATWIEAVPVVEKFQGRVVWEGAVQVFSVEHPECSRIYAWSHATTGTKRRYFAALGKGIVTSPEMAVRVAILAEAQRAAN